LGKNNLYPFLISESFAWVMNILRQWKSKR
jgi:hypothetical protein